MNGILSSGPPGVRAKHLSIFPEPVKTILSEANGRYQERGSKFLATLVPASSESEFQAVIEKLQREHHSARHLCWALRLSDKEKYSDAGEPHGTAGLPLLNVLSGSGIINAGLIVVRYFGGVKLGTGNLARAYRAAGEDAVRSATIIELEEQTLFVCSPEPSRTGEIFAVAERFGLRVSEQSYDPSPRIVLSVPEEKTAAVREILNSRGIPFETGGTTLVREKS